MCAQHTYAHSIYMRKSNNNTGFCTDLIFRLVCRWKQVCDLFCAKIWI